MHDNVNVLRKTLVPCPVCAATTFNVLYTPTRQITDPVKLYGAATGVQGTQQIVKCTECSMIYENPQYPEKIILSGYASSQEAGHDSQYPMRVASFLRTLNKLKAKLPPPGAKILDIGSAGGAFLEAAKQYGYDVVGLEPSRYLVEQAQKRQLDVHQGTIESHDLPAHSFDMVCLWDVLEHVVHPSDSLKRIKRLLRPGSGVLLINYPDIGTWQAKLAGSRFWWIISNHLHYFDRNTVKEICTRNGYNAFYFGRYWQTLTFGYLQDMAIHYRIPFAKLFKKITPRFIQNIPVSYYASQTTTLAKVVE